MYADICSCELYTYKNVNARTLNGLIIGLYKAHVYGDIKNIYKINIAYIIV